MNESMKNDFENVREQIGSCGIWCGGCVIGNGTLRGLTERYATLIKSFGLPEWGPEDVEWQGLLSGLTSIQSMPLCPGCLRGGGRDDCEMKDCAQDRGHAECNDCSDLSTCPHSKILHHMRTGALEAGIPVKTPNVERRAFMKRWEPEIKSKWPCCTLFAEDLRPDDVA
jgi:hypothetical protein